MEETMSKAQLRRAGVRTGIRAHEIRDAALVILDRSNLHKLLPCRDGRSRMMRSTELGNLSMSEGHGLVDIWRDHRKVFSMRHEYGPIYTVVSFRRGPWEDEILEAAKP
jgi:hypothetical protein